MTQQVGQLASISLDCQDADVLAVFYSRLLGLEEAFATPDRGVIALSGAGPMPLKQLRRWALRRRSTNQLPGSGACCWIRPAILSA
ncbi:catechol-2,3-dioxygenase [Arthrobacter sp. CAN_A6]